MPPEYTIDELAAECGVPSRTIRFYQSRGVLMPPEVRGRVAYYGPEHLQRIELISQLKSRGFQLRAIAELLRGAENEGVVLDEWWGLRQHLSTPWIGEQPVQLSEEKLLEILGPEAMEIIRAAGPELTAVVPLGGGTWRIDNPGLLPVLGQLRDAGIATPVAVVAGITIRKHLSPLAEELADHFLALLDGGAKGPPSTSQVKATFEVLRTAGVEAVRLIFAEQMGRLLEEKLSDRERAAVDEAGGVEGKKEGRSRGSNPPSEPPK